MAKKRLNLVEMLNTRKYDSDVLAIPLETANGKITLQDTLYNVLDKMSMKDKTSFNNTPRHKEANDAIKIRSWCKTDRQGNIIPNNFGDDINFTFLQELTGLKHIPYVKNRLNAKDRNYLMIGSMLKTENVTSSSYVWGTGMLRKMRINNKPERVYAVRGPLTRDVLVESGIQCPETYGDPALLMPNYYWPYIPKKYKLGIIPHHSHIRSYLLTKFKKDDQVKIIDFTSYVDWKLVIKQILSCQFIVSESLHGLIISEAYRIPNIWVSFGDIHLNFKYYDFFKSINKPSYEAFKITSSTTKEDLLKLKDLYNSTYEINLKRLANACPIKLYNLNMDNKIKPNTNKVLLVCIAKMENNYIREFVEYYKKLGFDNICLLDNNDPDGERFEDVINDYIESGFVILKDVRGMKEALIPMYTVCYNEYKDDYDWIAFFDIDEFLHIDGDKNIKQFLSDDKFNTNGVNCIRICWKQFDDSGIIKTNGDYSIKKFKTFLPITSAGTTQTKPIIRTCLDNLTWTSAHGPLKDKRLKSVNTEGVICDNAITTDKPTWKNACLNHYRFKTIEEYVLNKMVRLWPTHYLKGGKSGLNLKLFFMYNKRTPEKVAYAEKLLKEHNISRNEE